jgi:MFS family permease
LIAWYAACTGAVALGPWLAVLLVDAGWTAAQASLLMIAAPVLRIFGQPAAAWMADRVSPERVLRISSVAAAVFSVALCVVTGPWSVYFVMMAWAMSRAPAFPLVDATTVQLVGRRYGRVRAVGSTAFLVVVAASGLLRESSASAPVWIATVLALLTVLFTFRFPRLAPPPAPPKFASLVQLGYHPVLVPLSGIRVLHWASFSVYDTLFTLHVESVGLDARVAGGAVALGVGVEVFLLAAGPWLLDRVSPQRLLVVAVASGVPRFLVTGLVDEPAVLVGIQALHGLHFGAFWLATTALFSEQAPVDLRHSTQALLPTTAFGLGPLIGLGLASAVLSVSDTSVLFAVMAAFSAAAAVLAWRLRV